MPGLQLPSDFYVPAFQMRVGDNFLPPQIAKRVLDISITEVANESSSFSLHLNDETLELIDGAKGLLSEGTAVEIRMGYVGDLKKMMVGKISAVSVDFPDSGPVSLGIDGFDLLHMATRGTDSRTFSETELDSDIVKEIATEMGLTPEVDPTQPRKEARVQNHITNLKFLENLAEANGYFLWVKDNTLYFKEQRDGAPIRLERGKTLTSFSVRLSIAGQVEAIEVQSWDETQKQPISECIPLSRTSLSALSRTGRDEIGRGAGKRSVRVIPCYGGISTSREAQTLGRSIAAEQERDLIRSNGTSVGHPDIRVGTILDLDGIGRFNGRYFVERVTHTINESGYQTSFDVRQSA